ncbi:MULTISPECIES: alpha/beta hydrolase [unclassified Rhizobium]|jgi:monoterpene epsilon-lactone hydrolase|uniref:alpha/beta hydrolase n=1 Tax=unclassified Rhizobium TaxID=2613769 RepID=UPI000648FAF4|nr:MULTISPECIES: alpha/beta hydrolase [unclassified Rhizobium]MBN8953189.1 alpha/beta hydrolase [Rhizobium tropici]OJY75691.1 MAG: esterase [Rhizobium sp. 60-20]RKD75094.1 acetyl esterase/lipase [Rhizobium sp. WW_1]
MDDKCNGVKLPERTVPFPASISEEARAALRRAVGEDGTPLNAQHVMPDVSDFDGWMKLKAFADVYYQAAAERMAAQARASVQTVQIDEATVHIATPDGTFPEDCAYIDLHGGALVVGGGAACRAGAQNQADQHGIRCYAIDYRMPPEHPYPAALDDCMAVYRHVLTKHRPENVIIGGRSAGGNLAAAMTLRARDEGLPLPAALVLLSPELDLTESGDSFQVNRLVDVVLPGSLMPNNLLYAKGADLAHPYLSPLFGDFSKGFPPTFLQSGTRDLFLSNAVRMHRLLRRAEIPVELHVFEAMPHGGFMGAPEDRELSEEIKRFVKQSFGRG